jgi:predicted transcriptional regulator
MSRRNSLEITAEILDIADNGARKTQIVYEANLNHAFLEGYLKSLIEKGLIELKPEPTRTVKTTSKGKLFIKQYKSLRQIVS